VPGPTWTVAMVRPRRPAGLVAPVTRMPKHLTLAAPARSFADMIDTATQRNVPHQLAPALLRVARQR
jgi:hypothetical protein